MRTDRTGIPTTADDCRPLKDSASRVSKLEATLFELTALVIIGTHVLATVCAVAALELHGAAALPWLLRGELLMLALESEGCRPGETVSWFHRRSFAAVA